MWNKFLYWFYGTALGGKYLEYLIWKDNQLDKTQINLVDVQIVVQAQQLLYKEGLSKIKNHVNSIITSKTKEEYDQKLKDLVDLVPLAEREDPKLKEMKEVLYSNFIKKEKDIKSSSDFAKMIDQKIEDTKNLWKHKEKRELLRQIRKLRTAGEIEQAQKLEKEFFNRYGR